MAALPKPLSPKTIQKMFADWNPETVDKLHQYYAAFSNLYGVIMLSDAWKILKRYDSKIRKKEFLDFSTIARREDVPYYIFEIDELYSAEQRVSDAQRIIVNKALVSDGCYRFSNVYQVYELQSDKPYYHPERLTDFAETADTKQWKALHAFIRNLKTADGTPLSEYTCLTKMDQLDLEYFKSQSKKDAILKKASIPQSERIMGSLRIVMNTSWDNPIKYLFHKLEELGIETTEEQAETLLQLLQDANNYSHHWANCGWTPVELGKNYNNSAPRELSFGPGIQKAVADGDLDLDEFIEQLSAMGITVKK